MYVDTIMLFTITTWWSVSTLVDVQTRRTYSNQCKYGALTQHYNNFLCHWRANPHMHLVDLEQISQRAVRWQVSGIMVKQVQLSHPYLVNTQVIVGSTTVQVSSLSQNYCSSISYLYTRCKYHYQGCQQLQPKVCSCSPHVEACRGVLQLVDGCWRGLYYDINIVGNICHKYVIEHHNRWMFVILCCTP